MRKIAILISSLSAALALNAAHAQVTETESAPASVANAASQSLSPLQNTLSSPDVQWRLQLSPYAYHFHASSEHKPVYLIGVERETKGGYLWADGYIAGAAYFQNSFGQPSAFVYPVGGVYRDLAGVSSLYAKWMVGLMYGYVGQYQHKVPFNYGGFNPVIAPSLGYQFSKNLEAQIDLLGGAGLMFQINYRFK